MEHMKRFVKEITLHYKDHPAMLAFDVIHEPWEEPSQEYYIDSWKNSVYCYCEHSVRKFKKWLKEKYHNLDGLNQAWSRCYSDWEQVQPPRNFGAYTDWLDWRTFSTQMVAEECMQAGKTVKEYDPDRMIVNHCGGVLNAFNSSSDAFALAKTVDIPGASNYSIKSPQDAGMSCDILRTASLDEGNFWIGETSGGSGPMFSFNGEDIERFFAFRMPWSKQIQRKHIWKMISHGAKGVMYWMWRPELYGCETAAMGFTDREGNLTERTENAKQISSIIRKNKEFFLRSKPPKSEVAVLYNRNTSILEGFAATAKSVQGNAGLFSNYKDLWSLSGLAKIMMDNSIPSDYLNDDLIMEGALDHYRILILPYSICIQKKTVSGKIMDFVKRGGILVADALCGYFTEDGWGSEVVPAHGLDQVLGCKVLEYGYSLNTQITCDSALNNILLNSKFVKEKLQIFTAKVLGTFENREPAVTLNQYGKGQALYFASSLFMNEKETNPAAYKTLFRCILSIADVENPVSVDTTELCSGVEVRMLQTEQEKWAIVMNHNDRTVQSRIQIKGVSHAASVLDVENDISVAYELENRTLTFSAELKGLEVKIISIR